MADWRDLDDELDAWRSDGRIASFWWRDDDAVRPTEALERLLEIAAKTETPVALAVIPRDATNSLAELVSRHPLASVLQHGWSHENHAPPSEREEEFGPHRPLPVMLGQLSTGWRRLADFPRAFPVFVAPWNRIDPHVRPYLPAAGLTGVSTLGPRKAAEPWPGIRCVNVHVDIIDWRGTRGFMGAGFVLDQVMSHLRARRVGEADASEPTGLMTHHCFHDEACWGFIEEFVSRTRAQPAVDWLSAKRAFWP